ncbi:uncharacterized protein [Diadema setosum]|uniref:uncharacterized protein n=1 Tax=Diadema setosum TaxID=31175 RepID=UPI003B3B8B47
MASKSTNPGMEKAKRIIRRIYARHLYQCIIEITHAKGKVRSHDPMEIRKYLVAEKDAKPEDKQVWNKDHLFVAVSIFDYGMGSKNPFHEIPVYKKSQENKEAEPLTPQKNTKIVDGISDHDAVVCDVDLHPSINKKQPRRIFIYSKGDIEGMRSDFKTFQDQFFCVNHQQTTNENWLQLKNFLLQTMEKHIPSKLSRPLTKQPWITPSIKRMVRKKARLYKKARTTDSDKDWNQFRSFRKTVQKKIRSSYWSYTNDMLNDPDDKHYKKFWSFIKAKRQDNTGIPPMEQNGRKVTDSKNKARILNEQFLSVFTSESLDALPLMDDSQLPDVHRIKVTVSGVLKQLKELNVQKATGPDLIPARILKDMASEVVPILASIYQQSFDEGEAFDRVPHQRLLMKLQHYGIRGSLLKWFQNFLTKRSQRVVVDGQASEWTDVHSGVPQGTVLGPLLFLSFINDIADSIQSPIRLFADDCLIYRSVTTTEDCIALQKDLDMLHSWATKWQMKFNTSKCHLMRVSHRQNIINHMYHLGEDVIESVNKYPYLGLTLTSKLSWKTHIYNATLKANRMLGLIKRNLKHCHPNLKEKAYISLVRPHLEYCSTVWNPHHTTTINQVEAIQRRAARFVQNVYQRTESVTAMLQKMHWATLQSRREAAIKIMMYKITNNLIAINKDTYLKPMTDIRLRNYHPSKYQPLTTHSTKDVYRHSFMPTAIPADVPHELEDMTVRIYTSVTGADLTRARKYYEKNLKHLILTDR